MITNRQSNIMAFFITQALFLQIGYKYILNLTSNDSWMCFIFGSILGLLFCILINSVNNNKLFKIISLILSTIFIFTTLTIINNFIKTFYLPNTNPIIILLPLILITIYVSKKDYDLIALICESLFKIIIFILLISFLLVIFKCDITNITPIFNSSKTNIIKSTLIYFSLSTSPLILLKNINDNNINNGYIFSSLVLNITIILVITILGRYLIPLYKYPEYMILKSIKVFNFIEKIENILSIPWIIYNIILLFISSITIRKIITN